MIAFVADVRPFRALRYAPDLDLAAAVCPPFDVISPDQQRALLERSRYNAVHIELAENGSNRYRRAAEWLSRWRADDTLRREATPAFYLYDQQFEHEGRLYIRRAVFARLRLEPWEKGVIVPHEQTFGGPKEDRLKLLRATNLNASPVFLIYRDQGRQIRARLESAAREPPVAEFVADDGQKHTLRLITDLIATEALSNAFAAETLCVADGHHRYETALAYRDQRRAAAGQWTGAEPENFALVALTASDDPGLLVLPIHRVTAAGRALAEVKNRLANLFHIVPVSSPATLAARIAEHGASVPAFGLIAAEVDNALLLSVSDADTVDALLPQARSGAWRKLDYAIANYVILRHCLGLDEAQMSDYSSLWFTEDESTAVRDVREGRARYAVLMNPVPVTTVLDVADSGERMPQKSTFFYPKLPTGLVFNLVED